MAEHVFTFSAAEIDTPSSTPEWARLEVTFDAIQKDANWASRARTAWIDVREALDQVRSRPHGILTRTGGGVPNSYRQYADTTVVGIAWFTGADDGVHVRILANRITAPKSANAHKQPAVFGTADAHEAVYPQIKVPAPLKKDRKADPLAWEMRLALSQNPLDAGTRAALVDHLEEQGRGEEAQKHREALALVLSLTTFPAAV